jgi:hypothetical protein
MNQNFQVPDIAGKECGNLRAAAKKLLVLEEEGSRDIGFEPHMKPPPAPTPTPLPQLSDLISMHRTLSKP